MKFSCKNDFLLLKPQTIAESDYAKKYLQYKNPKNEEIESLKIQNQTFSELLTKIRSSNISKEINDVKKRKELKFQQSKIRLSKQLLDLSLNDKSFPCDENDVGISNAILAITKYKKYLIEKESQSNEEYNAKFNAYLYFIYRDIGAILSEIQSILKNFDADSSLKLEIQNSIKNYENFLNTPKSAFLSKKIFEFESLFIQYNQKLKDALKLKESVDAENNTARDHEQSDSPIPSPPLNSSKNIRDYSETITNPTDNPSSLFSADVLPNFSSMSFKNSSSVDQKPESCNIDTTVSNRNTNPFASLLNSVEIPGFGSSGTSTVFPNTSQTNLNALFSSNQNPGLFDLKSMLDETKNPKMQEIAQPSSNENQSTSQNINSLYEDFFSPAIIPGSMSNTTNTTNFFDNSVNKSTESISASANAFQVYTDEEKQAQDNYMYNEIEKEYTYAIQYLEQLQQTVSNFGQNNNGEVDFIKKFNTRMIFILSQSVTPTNFCIRFDEFKVFIANETLNIHGSQVFVKDYPGALEYISNYLVDRLLFKMDVLEIENLLDNANFAFMWILTTARIYPNILLIAWCKIVKKFPFFIGNYGEYHLKNIELTEAEKLRQATMFCLSLDTTTGATQTHDLMSLPSMSRLKICSLFVSKLFCVSLSNIWYYFPTTEDILKVWGPNRVWIILARIIKQSVPILEANTIFVCNILDLCAYSLKKLYKHQYEKFEHHIYNCYFPKVSEEFKNYSSLGEGRAALASHKNARSIEFDNFCKLAGIFRSDDFS